MGVDTLILVEIETSKQAIDADQSTITPALLTNSLGKIDGIVCPLSKIWYIPTSMFCAGLGPGFQQSIVV